MGWWADVKRVFAKAADSSRAEPVVHEVLTRHRDCAEALATWQRGIVCGALLDLVSEAYGQFLLAGQPRDEAVDFLDTPSAKGFVVHFDRLQYSTAEAEMLQLHLRQRVLANTSADLALAGREDATPAYRTQVADTKTYATARGQTERTDRYYLKPRPVAHADPALAAAPDTHTADQFAQGFGNILIELVVRDARAYRIRLSATIYHDRVYQEATAFAALMQQLLRRPSV